MVCNQNLISLRFINLQPILVGFNIYYIEWDARHARVERMERLKAVKIMEPVAPMAVTN
jgi:hypothetical protein